MPGLRMSMDEYLQPYGQLISYHLGLPEFPPYFNTFLASLLAFTVLPFLSSVACARIFPKTYNNLSRETRYAWNIHVVSMAHVVVVAPWALYLTMQSIPALDGDKAFGWDSSVGYLHAVSCAYFLWDTLETIYGGSGIAFTLHGASCLFIYSFSYRPFVAYYGPRALLWELSTPFLNIHWFLDKAGKTGSTFQLVNGIILLSLFFFVRIGYGIIVSISFFSTMYGIWEKVPRAQLLLFSGGNVLLNVLNYIWFAKMVAALRKRFPKDATVAPNGSGYPVETITVDGQDLMIPGINGTAPKEKPS